jgi:uncharacterized protein
VPFGALQHTMKHADPLSPLLMAAVAIPTYSTPLPGMMRVGLMFDHGNSIGAAFGLFVLGIGLSLGTLAYLGSDFGWRRVGPWAACYLGVVLGLGYLAQPLLYDTRKVELDHTHAFDDFSNPFPAGSADTAVVRVKLAEKFGPLERPAVGALLLLSAVGLVARRLDRGGRLEAWLTAKPAPAAGRRWDVAVPGVVLGVVTLVGLVAFSVIGAFVYYPDREQCKAQMAAVYANAAVAVRTGHADEAMRELELWDLLVRKLEVGESIRRFGVTAEQSRAAAALREAIEGVRDHLLARDQPAAVLAFKDGVEAAYRECKAAYGR